MFNIHLFDLSYLRFRRLKETEINSNSAKSTLPMLVCESTLGCHTATTQNSGRTRKVVSVRFCVRGQQYVAQSVVAWPSELEGRQFNPRHSIDVCFNFPLLIPCSCSFEYP